MIAGLVKYQRLGLGHRDHDPGTIGVKIEATLVLRNLHGFLLDPAFPVALVRDRDPVAVVLLLQDAHLVSHEHLCLKPGLGERLFVDVGKRSGHDPEAGVLRRLGKACHGKENDGEPEQNYGEKFGHWMSQENGMECRVPVSSVQ